MPLSTSKFWREKVRELVENAPGASAAQIARQVKALASSSDTPPEERGGYPAERTVRDLRAAHLESPTDERESYGYMRWPESFEAGLLEWRHSRLLLDVLALYRITGSPPPTIRAARWYCRFADAAPDLGEYVRHTLLCLTPGHGPAEDDEWRALQEMQVLVWAPRTLAALEALHGVVPPEASRGVEGWLAARAWFHEPDQPAAEGQAWHQRLVAQGVFPSWEPDVLEVDKGAKSTARVAAAFSELRGTELDAGELAQQLRGYPSNFLVGTRSPRLRRLGRLTGATNDPTSTVSQAQITSGDGEEQCSE